MAASKDGDGYPVTEDSPSPASTTGSGLEAEVAGTPEAGTKVEVSVAPTASPVGPSEPVKPTPAEPERKVQRTPSVASTDDIEHVVKEGETLWAICERYYNDATLTSRLMKYNHLDGGEPVQPGLRLKIPIKKRL